MGAPKPPEPVYRLRRALIEEARAKAAYLECLRRVREAVVAARKEGISYYELARWLADAQDERLVWARRLKDRYRVHLRGRRVGPADMCTGADEP